MSDYSSAVKFWRWVNCQRCTKCCMWTYLRRTAKTCKGRMSSTYMLASRRSYQYKIGRLSLIIGQLIRPHALYKRPSCSVIHSKLDFHSASADPAEYCCSLWKLNKDGQRPEKPRWALSVLNVFASLNSIGGPGFQSLSPLDSPSRVYVNVGEDHKGRSKILALR